MRHVAETLWPARYLPALAAVVLLALLAACSSTVDGSEAGAQRPAPASTVVSGSEPGVTEVSPSSGVAAPVGEDTAVVEPLDPVTETLAKVKALYLAPSDFHAGIDISAEAELSLPEGATSVFVQYAWFINGEQYLYAQGEKLSCDAFTRGDSIYVEVMPLVDGIEGKLFRSDAFKVPNAVPSIVSDPAEGVVQESLFSYQVRAEDADGDELEYFVEDAPAGLQVDRVSGAVSWDFSSTPAGPHRFKVGVRDPYEGVSYQEVQLDLGDRLEEKRG